MDDKTVELKCLEMVRKNKPIGGYATNIYRRLMRPVSFIDNTVPDLLFGSLGVEHFLVDIGLMPNGAPINKVILPKAYDKIIKWGEVCRDTSNIINDQDQKKPVCEDSENCRAPGIICSTLCSGIADLKKATNLVFDMTDRHDANKDLFFNEFVRVYDKHYSSILEYRKRLNRVGFLIELPYYTISSVFECFVMDERLRYNSFVPPVLSSVLDHIIENSKGLSFVILCYHPAMPTNYGAEYKMIYINTKDVYRSVLEQRVPVCDSFKYVYKSKADISMIL